jgi:O-antigen/teichoic acid export membrane protein
MFGKTGDKRFYSKVLTYLTFGLVWAGMALSLFSKEIIKLLAQKQSFWPSYEVVPVIVLSYVFFGMRIVSSLGMYLNKKTKYVAYTTVAAAALNIILNIIFIPEFGMMTAAYSTLISFIFLYLISYYYGNISYSIPFENLKIVEAIIIGVLLYICAAVFNNDSLIIRITVKFAALILYPFLLYLFRFYEAIELERVKGFILKWRNPLKWIDNLRSSSINGLSSENNQNNLL